MKKFLVLISSCACILSACYYDNEEQLYGEQPCSSEQVTYTGTIENIISNHCLSCHNATESSGGITLETYEQVKTLAQSGKLIGVITHADGFPAMPKDASKLSECNIEAITTWVEGGSLNN